LIITEFGGGATLVVVGVVELELPEDVVDGNVFTGTVVVGADAAPDVGVTDTEGAVESGPVVEVAGVDVVVVWVGTSLVGVVDGRASVDGLCAEGAPSVGPELPQAASAMAATRRQAPRVSQRVERSCCAMAKTPLSASARGNPQLDVRFTCRRRLLPSP
jgi:hypothetical protein